MKYKIGDKVRIVKERIEYNWNTCMDIYCGTIMTISKAYGHYYKMKEDDGDWSWFENMIEGLAEEEWKPKEGDMVKVGLNSERVFLYTTNTGRHIVVCYGEEDRYRNGRSFGVTTYDEIFKDEKKERKLMLTDSEWEKFQKDNNL